MRDRSHLTVITSSDRPYTPDLIRPALPHGLEYEVFTHDTLVWMAGFFDSIQRHECPHCACGIDHVVQVGRAIDAFPCGHRLGTGKINHFAAAYRLPVMEG